MLVPRQKTFSFSQKEFSFVGQLVGGAGKVASGTTGIVGSVAKGIGSGLVKGAGMMAAHPLRTGALALGGLALYALLRRRRKRKEQEQQGGY